jgi:hypothetical protein
MKKTEKTPTYFAFRIDTWIANGESVVEHLAGVEDYTLGDGQRPVGRACQVFV